MAVGDEEGWVHLFDTDPKAAFTPHLRFRCHHNAIMDLQFSSDDKYLATASGDQSAQIIDMITQQCIAVLANHTSSVKQVCFQPEDDNIIATSSRDGTVRLWDLRCSGNSNIAITACGTAPYASSIRTITGAHADILPATPPSNSRLGYDLLSALIEYAQVLTSTSERKIESARRGDISITSLSFLGPGREHLLLTASDASSCVKLWDIRGRYSRKGPSIPVSTTRHPESHERHRHFAINSLTLNTDFSRLYALSKDNTVYAYSTSHLILGHAPELAVSECSRQKHMATNKEGLGPLYGFRHQNFHAGSFYVKSALRKSRGDQTELLAVGSTDGCPVLFPTDERFLRSSRCSDNTGCLPSWSPPSGRPGLRSSGFSSARSSSSFSSFIKDTIPIFEIGTPLIRGHDTEVTSVTWAQNGSLVSIADDYRVRCWREGPMAADLRAGGEEQGRRWGCGWAAVDEEWDELE